MASVKYSRQNGGLEVVRLVSVSLLPEFIFFLGEVF